MNATDHALTNITSLNDVRQVTCLYAVTLSVTSFIANGLVALAYTKDPTGRLRTPLNHFLVTLCLSDAFISCIPLPLFVFVRYNFGYTKATPTLEKAIDVAFFVTLTASMLNLLALVVDRFVAIQWPFLYRVNINVIRSRVISVFTAVVALTVGAVSLFAESATFYFVVANVHTITNLIALTVSFACVSRKLQKQESTFIIPAKQHLSFVPLKLEESFIFPEPSLRRQARREYRRPRTDSLAIAFFARQDRVRRSYCLQIGVVIFVLVPSCFINYCIRYQFVHSAELKRVLRDVYLLMIMTTSLLNPIFLALRLRCFKNSLKIIFSPSKKDDKLDQNTSSTCPSKKVSDASAITYLHWSRSSGRRNDSQRLTHSRPSTPRGEDRNG